jgi:hypothetical protein
MSTLQRWASLGGSSGRRSLVAQRTLAVPLVVSSGHVSRLCSQAREPAAPERTPCPAAAEGWRGTGTLPACSTRAVTATGSATRRITRTGPAVGAATRRAMCSDPVKSHPMFYSPKAHEYQGLTQKQLTRHAPQPLPCSHSWPLQSAADFHPTPRAGREACRPSP